MGSPPPPQKKKSLLSPALLFLTVLFIFFAYVLYRARNSSSDTRRIIIDVASGELGKLTQDDPALWQHIKNYHTVPPSKDKYNLDDPKNVGNPDSNFEVYTTVRAVLKHLNKKKNGVFVEVGAYDGETSSSTLVFEQNYGWSGLLIEADP